MTEHKHIFLVEARAGSKYLLRFVGNPVPSRSVYRKDETENTRLSVTNCEKLQEAGIKFYHEAFAICFDVHGDGCLSIVHLPEPLVLAIQRFVQSGGPDPGASTSTSFLIEVGTGNPVTFYLTAAKPNDLDSSVYERAAGMKEELYALAASAPKATTSEVVEMHEAGELCSPYRSEGEAWFEPVEVVELIRECPDRTKLYEKFLTYASECCDDPEVSMIAGILCRTKE